MKSVQEMVICCYERLIDTFYFFFLFPLCSEPPQTRLLNSVSKSKPQQSLTSGAPSGSVGKSTGQESTTKKSIVCPICLDTIEQVSLSSLRTFTLSAFTCHEDWKCHGWDVQLCLFMYKCTLIHTCVLVIVNDIRSMFMEQTQPRHTHPNWGRCWICLWNSLAHLGLTEYLFVHNTSSTYVFCPDWELYPVPEPGDPFADQPASSRTGKHLLLLYPNPKV